MASFLLSLDQKGCDFILLGVVELCSSLLERSILRWPKVRGGTAWRYFSTNMWTDCHSKMCSLVFKNWCLHECLSLSSLSLLPQSPRGVPKSFWFCSCSGPFNIKCSLYYLCTCTNRYYLVKKQGSILGPTMQMKDRVFHLGRNIPRWVYILGTEQLESGKQLCKKGPGSLGGQTAWTWASNMPFPQRRRMVIWFA